MAYTGIGSQKTPKLVQEVMRLFALTMNSRMRSGGANGADTAFELGARNKEIYLPWRGFNGHTTGIWQYTPEQTLFAREMAQEVYPVVIKPNHINLFSRNVHQIVGLATCMDDAKPSKFVMCWTPDGCINKQTYKWGVTGGTGIAILVAEVFDVPVYNLARPEHMRLALDHISEFFDTVKIEKQLSKQGYL